MRALKLIDTLIAPHLCHLIYSICLTCIYPEILKTSLMSPGLKKGKDPYHISSYRPLNNLSSIDKVIQEYLKLSLIEFLESSDIIIENHHRGRKFHSTTSAL